MNIKKANKIDWPKVALGMNNNRNMDGGWGEGRG